MKSVLITSCVVVTVFIVALGFAQSDGRQKEGSDSPQMQGGQMMRRDMMISMTETMKQMNHMMEMLAHPMHHMTVTDHARMNEVGKIMRRMASEMTEMAVHMEKGGMDEAAVKKMRERMKTIDQEIETLRKKNY